jgi:hypothetical protein
MIWIIFAHFIGDIALQAPWQADNKGKYWYVMLAHCMIWTACISIALQYLGLFAGWKVVFLLAGHWVCDKWKTTIPKTPENWKYIYPDQLWHLVQCIIVKIF